MVSSHAVKSFTVRLPADRYEAVRAVARARRKSVNAIVAESLANLIRDEEQRKLAMWFDELGACQDECDVEFAFAGQSEVVLDGPR